MMIIMNLTVRRGDLVEKPTASRESTAACESSFIAPSSLAGRWLASPHTNLCTTCNNSAPTKSVSKWWFIQHFHSNFPSWHKLFTDQFQTACAEKSTYNFFLKNTGKPTFQWKTNRKSYVAYRMASMLVTLHDLEGHSQVAGFFKCNLSNICAAFCKISRFSTDSVLTQSLGNSWTSC